MNKDTLIQKYNIDSKQNKTKHRSIQTPFYRLIYANSDD